MTLPQLRQAEQLALDAWKDAARRIHSLQFDGFASTSPVNVTDLTVARGNARVREKAWAHADAELRAALEAERAA
jgi:hypothetical protein